MVFLQYAIEYVSLHLHAIFSKMFFDNRDMPNDQDQFEWVDSAIEGKKCYNFFLVKASFLKMWTRMIVLTSLPEQV